MGLRWVAHSAFIGIMAFAAGMPRMMDATLQGWVGGHKVAAEPGFRPGPVKLCSTRLTGLRELPLQPILAPFPIGHYAVQEPIERRR